MVPSFIIPEFSNEQLNFSDTSPTSIGNSFITILAFSALFTGNVFAKKPSFKITFSILQAFSAFSKASSYSAFFNTSFAYLVSFLYPKIKILRRLC